MLETELDFFISNQDELVKRYSGQVVVIKNREVIGVYQSPLEAYLAAQKEHKLGSFMIQPVSEGPSAYTVTISSSVVFQQ
jgi:hypothetical protein